MDARRTMAALCGLLLVACGATDAHAQLWFESSGMLLERDNGSDVNLISGPDRVAASLADFRIEPAYRLSAGAGFGDWEVNASYTRTHDWSAQLSGFLDNPVVLDDTASNDVVVPTTPANTFGFVNSLFAAATGGVEASESEQLQTGSSYLFQYASQYDDYEISVGANRGRYPVRASLGYRCVRLDESSQLFVTGVFDALDSDDGAVSGDATNEPNDALADGSLTGAGLMLVAGTADGWDAADVPALGPDVVSMQFGGLTRNVLHGGQLTLAADVYADDRLIVEGIAKMGLYYNRIQGNVNELFTGSGNDDSVYGRTLTDQASVGTFVGGLAVRGIYNITSHLSVTGGYEATFLSNVALSPEQTSGIGTTAAGMSTYSVVTDGTVIIQGGQVGLNLTW